MNVLFLTLVDFNSLQDRNIYTDLLRVFVSGGHSVYVISPAEAHTGIETHLIDDGGARILKLKIGNTQKTNIIRKGISTVMIEPLFKRAIKKYFSDVSFDLVLYSTPPITLLGAIKYVKKRDGAKTYLLLKDIFPQNALDVGMLSTGGLKGPLYKHFRRQEKKLYAVSDKIGCMSKANERYILSHNAELESGKVEVCPNSIEVAERESAWQGKQSGGSEPACAEKQSVEQDSACSWKQSAEQGSACPEKQSVMQNSACSGKQSAEQGTASPEEQSGERGSACVEKQSVEQGDMHRSKSEDSRSALRRKYGLPLDKKVFVYGGNLGAPQGVPFIIECLKKCTGRDSTAGFVPSDSTPDSVPGDCTSDSVSGDCGPNNVGNSNGESNSKKFGITSNSALQNAFFLIAGSGTEAHLLKDFIEREKPENVKFLSALPKNDYDRLVSACDVGLIFLDYRFTIPNFPSRLLSYMQAGLPVLACTDPNTDIGDVIAEGGFGWKTLSNDTEAFKNTVLECLKTDLNAPGERAYQYLKENYSVSGAYKTIMRSVGNL